MIKILSIGCERNMIEESKKEDKNLIEASIGRLKQHLDSGDVFVVVSAFRQEYSRSENHKRQRKLIGLIKSHTLSKPNESKIGHFDVVGGFDEEGKDGKKKTVEEISTFTVGKSDQTDKILKLGLSLGKEFEQDSILYCHDGKVYEVFTRNTKEHNIGYEKLLGKYHYDIMNQDYSRIRGHRFTASKVSEEIEYSKPSSIFEGMRFQSETEYFNKTGELSVGERKVLNDSELIKIFADYCNRG